MAKTISFLGRALVWLTIILCLAAAIVPAFLDRIYYRGSPGGHYDGARFFNPNGPETILPAGGRTRTGFFARWVLGADGRQPWPRHVPITPAAPPARVDGDAMRVTWVGHATVLVQTRGLNILTDPNWDERAGPFGLGPKRVTRPGIDFDRLPRIDLVLVSHNHYDHMSLETIARLWRRDRPAIVTSLGNDTLIRRTGARAIALDWGGHVAVRPGIAVHATRNHHWSSRWFVDRNRALWSSFVITLPGGNLMFAGDTGFGDGGWPGEAAQLGPIRLALIPIGAFRFAPGMMDTGSHIGPIQAVEVLRRSGARTALAIHWGTFQLSNEARETPPRMLAEAMKCAALPPQMFHTMEPGGAFEVPPLGPVPTGRDPDAACLSGPAIARLK